MRLTYGELKFLEELLTSMKSDLEWSSPTVRNVENRSDALAKVTSILRKMEAMEVQD